jgi:acyl-ACP thioesterase
MPELGAERLLPPPKAGRTFSATRLARFGDLDLDGRLRFDAVARYVQDVSGDDTVDAGLDNVAWVVRRTKIEVRRSPRFREQLTLCTFCSGLGRRWAERRVSVVGERGAAMESVSLWIHLDAVTGRPAPMPEAFHRQYDQAADGRVVSTRLQHDAEPPVDLPVRPWTLRATDFDLLGHVNNAATWAAVEDVLAERHPGTGPIDAELEYRLAIEPGDTVAVVSTADPDGQLRIWLTDPAPDAPRVYATALVRIGKA